MTRMVSVRQFAHWCQDGHEQIGWNGDHEVCPMCRAFGTRRADFEAGWKAYAAWKNDGATSDIGTHFNRHLASSGGEE